MTNNTSKEIIFFLLIFIIIVLSGSLSDVIYTKVDKHHLAIIMGVSLVSTLILFGIYKISKVKEEGFHFEVTSAKNCDGGSYMHQSNETCQHMWHTPKGVAELSNYTCIDCNYNGGLYKGRPLNMGYRQDVSDDNWENNLCHGNFLRNDSPMVL
jgi:hypothetical protein